MDCGIGLFEGTLLVTAVLNILELINNWTSINKFIYHYRYVSLFFIDLLTLGLFYTQVLVLSRILLNGGVADILLRLQFVLAIYIFLYGVYVVWNMKIIKNVV